MAAAAAFASAVVIGVTAASAQTPAPAAKETTKAAAPAAAAPAKDAAKAAPAAPAAKESAAAAPAAGPKQSSWVKLCDKVSNTTKDKDGKDLTNEKNVCATFHDTVDANSGLTVVSAAIRTVDGNPKPDLQVTVPLGMIIPAGARVSVLTQEQSDKLKKEEKLEAKDLKQVELKYTACLPNGCTAEVEAPDDILEQMKTGSVLLVRSIYVSGQPFAAPVPLTGFTEAQAGKPVDAETYKKARAEMMKTIRERQAQLVEKYNAEKAEQMKNLPMDAPGAPKSTTAAPATTGATPAAKPAAPAAPADKK